MSQIFSFSATAFFLTLVICKTWNALDGRYKALGSIPREGREDCIERERRERQTETEADRQGDRERETLS